MRILSHPVFLLGLLASLLLGDFFVGTCVAQTRRVPVYARRRAYRQNPRVDYAWQNRDSRYVAQPQSYQSRYRGGYQSSYYLSRPMVTGSYYTRPYPQHFDVYSRGRYRAVPQPVVAQPTIVPDVRPVLGKPSVDSAVTVELAPKK